MLEKNTYKKSCKSGTARTMYSIIWSDNYYEWFFINIKPREAILNCNKTAHIINKYIFNIRHSHIQKFLHYKTKFNKKLVCQIPSVSTLSYTEVSFNCNCQTRVYSTLHNQVINSNRCDSETNQNPHCFYNLNIHHLNITW